MDFYPPLNLDNVFDRINNERAIAKFGFIYGGQNKLEKSKTQSIIPKSKSHFNLNKSFRSQVKLNSTDKLDQQHINQATQTQYNPINQSSTNPLLSRDRSQLFQSTPNLIRKLGQNERIFHGGSDNSRSYIYRICIVTSEIDLYRHIDIVHKGIQEWKALHPLLRCRVVTKPGSTDPKEKYFAFASDAKVNNIDNVKFLYYNSHGSKTCDDIWKLLVEKDTTMVLDGENGLLWRLHIVQIRNLPKADLNGSSHLYAFLLTYDHSIMDGRSSYYSILQLVSIIEDLYTASYRRAKENSFLPSKEDIYKDRRQSAENMFVQRFYIKAPKFMDVDSALKSSYIRLKYLTPEEEKVGMIYTHDHKPYVSVKELVDISKNSNSKFRTLVINKPDLTKILKKCKENGVKLTTFLNMALILALRNIHDKHEEDPVKKNALINYITNISLREFPEFSAINPDKNFTIGCYIGLSFNSFKDPLVSNNNPNWINDFWRLSRRESDDFHAKLSRGDYIHSIHLPSKKKDRDEFFYHFGNSNLGVLPSTLDDRKLIKIRQTFATGRYSRENFLCWFSNLIATIDNQLCWTISFNTFSMRQELINEIIENLTRVVKDLIR